MTNVQGPASWASFGASCIQGRGPRFRVWELGPVAQVSRKFFPTAQSEVEFALTCDCIRIAVARWIRASGTWWELMV